MNPVQLSFDTVAASVAIVSAVAVFAVCRWRIMDLERRVEMLEDSERNQGDRMVAVETKLDSATHILERIADKLEIS